MKKNNTVAKILFGLGIFIIVAGVIGSFICGNVFEATEIGYYRTYSYYNWGLVILGLIGSILGGALFIAISEIIEQLNHINAKISKGLSSDSNGMIDSELADKTQKDR